MASIFIGEQVRWARRRAGLTQDQLAELLGMPQPSISRIERGSVLPRTATLMSLLEATGHRLTVEPIRGPIEPDAIRRTLAMHVARRARPALGRAAANAPGSPLRILRRLRWFNVPFVLVGELAESVRGVPGRIGRDLEVCHATTDVARERLKMALEDLGTHARRLHLMTETATGDPYELLIRNADNVLVDASLLVRVAAVEDLIRTRQRRATDRDRQAIAVLRAIQGVPPVRRVRP